jgi:MFS transporter, FSR family, fosmidomycin resistance protein
MGRSIIKEFRAHLIRSESNKEPLPLMNKFNLKVLLLLSLGHCVTDIYQGSLPVILPFLKAKLDLSYTTAGMILIASNVASSVVQPIFGYFSDKKGKPLLLPLGVFCAGLGFSLLPLTSDYIVVLALVLLSGLGVAAYHPEGFKTASYFTGQRPAAGMSIFSVGGNLGFALAPMLSLLVIKHYGLDGLPLMMVLALTFLTLILIFWKKIHVSEKPASGLKTKASSVTDKGAYAAMTLLISVVVMRSWTQFGLISYVPFYYIDYLKGDPLYAGQLLSAFLISGVIGTLIGAQVADRWGHKRMLMATMAMASVALPFIFVAEGGMLLLIFALLGFFLVASFSVTMVMAQRLLPNNVGMASGLSAGFAIGTGGAGVTILGVVADAYGVLTALQCIMIMPLAGFALSLFIKYPGLAKK